MAHSNNEKMADNQYIIRTGGAEVFRSYDVVVAVRTDDGTILDEKYWDYSRTTTKYLVRFLRLGEGGKRIIEGRIEAGLYRLADLN